MSGPCASVGVETAGVRERRVSAASRHARRGLRMILGMARSCRISGTMPRLKWDYVIISCLSLSSFLTQFGDFMHQEKWGLP